MRSIKILGMIGQLLVAGRLFEQPPSNHVSMPPSQNGTMVKFTSNAKPFLNPECVWSNVKCWGHSFATRLKAFKYSKKRLKNRMCVFETKAFGIICLQPFCERIGRYLETPTTKLEVCISGHSLWGGQYNLAFNYRFLRDT